jgi:DNA polymerase-3 subunit alpha
MVKNGIDEKTAQAIWELFPPFARYGFNRSHAVCYAMTSYQTAYLKAHYPIEFMTSLLNCDAGDIDRISFLVSESKKSGIDILPPDINSSMSSFTPDENKIRFGLAAIKNVGQTIVTAIIEERTRGGPFTNLVDLLQRVQHKDLNKKSLESLAKCGALDSLKLERNILVGNIDDIIKFSGALKQNSKTNQGGLFGGCVAVNSLKLKNQEPADTKTKLAWEKELLGLFVSGHPLNLHKDKIQAVKARTVRQALDERSEMQRFIVAGIVTKVQKIVTKKGAPMAFAKLEDLNDSIEAVIFPEVFGKTLSLWQENTAVLLTGKMSYRNNEAKFMCDNGQLL